MSAPTFVMPNDLSDLCRVCLQLPEESQYLDLTTIYDEEDNLTYGECFTVCTHIDLSAGEGVPHHLCKSCGLELQMTYDFYKKIEESKKVIEQCRRQIEEQQKENTQHLLAGQPNNPDTHIIDGSRGMEQLINAKYELSDDDVLPGTSQDMEHNVRVMDQENEENFAVLPNENAEEVSAELDIISKICEEHGVAPDKDDNRTIEEVGENYAATEHVEDNLEIEDYQNLEALDEEETETLQIQSGNNTNIPTQSQTLQTEDNGEFEGFDEDEDQINNKDEMVEDEVVDLLESEDFIEESNNDDNEEHFKWQENVVAVANKEHLPIEIENDEEEEIEEISYENEDGTVYILEECFSNDGNEKEITSNTNSINIEKYKRITKTTSKNNTPRKRHVGTYSCDYCQRVFPNYSRMKTHRRCHEKDRPKLTCSQCGRMYATKQAHDAHVQTAHEKSGYPCSFCNKVFAIRKSLEIHVRYHTGDFPHACNLCDRKFAQVCHLNTHINVKHNQIRFSCDYPGCGKFFTSSTSLRNHEFTHGVMPFECEFCHEGYPAKAKLRVHIQRKHGVEMTIEQLESMRKFHVMRSKVNLVQFVDS